MKRPLTALILLPILALPLLGSCALFESRETRALRRAPEYRSGYSDGCASSRPSANPRADTLVRDEEAYRGVRAYRLGWNEGHGGCRGLSQMQTMPSGGLGGGSALGGGGLGR